jgi:hypothetical protein
MPGAVGVPQALFAELERFIAGSGITFADRGSSELRGIPGEWRLFAVGQEAA